MGDTMTSSPAALEQDPMRARKLRYTIAVLCVSLILALLLQNPEFPTSMRLVLLALLLLGLIRWSAALLLILFQLDLYLADPAYTDTAEPPGLLIAFFCVVLLMILSRLRSSQELTGIRSIVQLLTGVVKAAVLPSESMYTDVDNGPQPGRSGSEMFSIALRALILVLGAGILLVTFPPDQSSVQHYGLTPDGMRSLSIGLVLITAYFVVSIPLTEIWWKRMTPDQAGIYLRSRFLAWLHRDLRLFERKQLRHRRKQARDLQRVRRKHFLQFPKKVD